MIFHSLLWKVFPLLQSIQLLISPYLHSPILHSPPPSSFFFITIHKKTSTIRTPQRNASVHLLGGGILFHYKSPTIIDKHQARFYIFWNLSNLQGLIYTCKTFFFLLNSYFYFVLLYNTVLVLPYIDMNPPRVYMRSQT